jgi:septum site-determining protein MinC
MKMSRPDFSCYNHMTLWNNCSMGPKIQIKGVKDGLLVVLGEGEWPELHQALLETLDQQLEFFRGAKLFIDLGNLIMRAVEMGQLRDEISERGLNLWGILSNSPTTESTAQILGLATRLSRPSKALQQRSIAAADTHLEDGEEAILVHRTLRSGFSLKYPGHVVVIGDVNPGAEVTASGNVIVWGRLRGSVHAGAEGNNEAVICALDLSPMQLRIAGQVANPPQRRNKPQPEMAHVKEGQIVAEAWKAGFKLFE